MKTYFSNRRLRVMTAIAAVSVFFALAFAASATHRPQIDEGMFASPALNLATEGFFGTTVLEIERSPLTRINERTYWVLPLYLLNTAASFKVFGFSLFTMRLVNVFWGFALIAAWYFIARELSKNAKIAVLTLILVACNYTVLDTAASGRMDMMSASLGFIALAAYLTLRERHLAAAVFVSQSFVVLAGLTHPNGIMAFAGLLFATIYFDFRSLKPKHVFVAAVPYLVGGTAFGIWVLQDFAAFKDQFIDNVLMSGRMEGFESPLSGFIREFTERYPHAHGLQANSGGHAGPIYLKSLILVGYVAGFFGVLLTKSLRSVRNYRALLVMTTIYFVVMSLIDGQKETPYLIHIVPFYSALLAIFVVHLSERKIVPQPILLASVCVFIALQIGGMALRVRQNTYGNFYQPAVDYLKQNATASDTIMASSDFGFGLNFPPNLLDDGRFGYNTGKRPRFIVYDDQVKTSWEESQKFFPAFYDYFQNLLNNEYRVVYENDAYKIYEKR